VSWPETGEAIETIRDEIMNVVAAVANAPIVLMTCPVLKGDQRWNFAPAG
jgi:hypothetical protein